MSDTLSLLHAALGPGYRIDRELGGGGMSRVFLAEDLSLGRRVVVKVLPEELAAASVAERFTRETRVLASLQHPHIVPLIAAGGSRDLLWFTMPFVEGESLRARLEREGELPVPEAVRLWGEILDALAYAHGRGVVHRDIKPENILISGRHVMVADFGVARALADATGATRATGTGVAIGTPAYMSPEQAVGDPNVDHRADLYAAGLVMYEMLCGVGPYNERNPARLIVAHTTAPVPGIRTRRAQVSPALEALVLRCLEKRPADRPQRAEEVLAELGALSTGERAEASGSVGALASTKPKAARATATQVTPAPRRGLRIGLAVAAVAVVAAGLWFTRGRGGGPPPAVTTAQDDTLRLDLLMLPPTADPRDSLLVASALEALVGRFRDNRQLAVADFREVPPDMATPRLYAGWTTRDSLLRWAPDMRFHAHLSLSIVRADPGYLLTAIVRTVLTDSTVVSVQRSAASISEVPAAIQGVSDEVYGALAQAVGRVPRGKPNGAMFGISPDAATLWVEGTELFYRREYLAASERLRAVTRLEPQFAEAWVQLHFALSNAGINRDEQLRAIATAYRLRDSIPIVPMRDRVVTDYLRLTGNNAGAVEVYQRYERQGISINANNYAISLQELRRPEDALRVFARARDTTYRRPGFANSNYVGTLLDLRRVDEARREVHLLDSIAGRDNPTARIARSLLARHWRSPDSLLAHLRPELSGDLPPSRLIATLNLLRVAELTRGAVSESRRAADRRRELLRASVAPADLLDDDLADLATRARMGLDVAALRRELDAVYSRALMDGFAPMDRPYANAINAHALLGRLDEARRLLAEADRVIPAEFREAFIDGLNGARGELALAEGKGADALRYFRAADSGGACVPCWYGEYAQAFDVLGNADSSLVAWERYIASPSYRMTENDASFLARAYRRAGELREARGDVDAALRHYRAFVALWRAADPPLQPVVEDMKQRIARLERTQG